MGLDLGKAVLLNKSLLAPVLTNSLHSFFWNQLYARLVEQKVVWS